jgi:hypothetical protein
MGLQIALDDNDEAQQERDNESLRLINSNVNNSLQQQPIETPSFQKDFKNPFSSEK